MPKFIGNQCTLIDTSNSDLTMSISIRGNGEPTVIIGTPPCIPNVGDFVYMGGDMRKVISRAIGWRYISENNNFSFEVSIVVEP